MAASNYQPVYNHVDWLDNVDRVQAGGGHGFNVEFKAIQAEFSTLARVLGANLTLPGLTWGNNCHLQADQGGSIELGGDVDTPGTGWPYIDFHFSQLKQDFNTRLINDADGQLTVASNPGHFPTGDNHVLNVQGETGIRQQQLFISGGTASNTWSSISFNAHHALDANQAPAWQFPDTSHPAATIEMDAAGVGGSGGARFEVYLTTKAQPTAFRRALAIDGENLGVTVDQRLNAAAGLEGNGVCVGWDAGGLGYAFPYESVGVNSAIYNLRLQSPNQIFFHTANQQRGGIDQAGTFRLTGSAAIAGNIGTAGRDPVSGLPTGWGGGVHTWDVYAEGTIGIGPGNGAVLASLGNDGTVSGVRKPFVIDHPLGEDRHLVHAAIEGPEYGVYYRGEGRLEDGRATITLPRYFEALCREQGRSAQLTPKVEPGADPPGVLGVTEVRDGQFGVVAGQGCAPDQAFFWEVKAVRMDVDVLIPEPLRSENPIIVAMARRGDERNARADAGPARGAAGGVEQRGPSPATAGAGGGADA